MSQEGQRHAEELARLEARKKDLEDALMRLARDEAEAQEVAELAQEVEQLENEVESARAAKRANSPIEEKTMTEDVRKAAGQNREAAEAELDKLAKSMQQDCETFEKAYLRALDTDMGKALMQTRNDAKELERGGITSMDVADAHKRLSA